MKKRILSILMMAVLLLAMLPAIPAGAEVAWPAVSSTVTIGGKDYIYQGNTAGGHFFDSNIVASAYRVGTDGYILWDGVDTLTLHNANLTTMSYRDGFGYGIGIDYGTVILEGQNKINITVSDSNLFTYESAVGLLYEGYRDSLSDRNVLMGSGSLEIDVKHTGNRENYYDYTTYGLYSYDDLAVIGCDLNIDVNSYLATSACALCVDEGMTVTGAKIVADARADAYACCINVAKNLYATGSTLLGTSDGSYNAEFNLDYLDCINAFGDMTLIDCIVRGETCEGDTAEDVYGLYSDGNMAIKNTAIIMDFPYDYGDQYDRNAVMGENIYIEKSFIHASEGSLIAYGSASDGVLNLVDEYITRPTGTMLFTNEGETGLVYSDSNELVDGFMITGANYSDVAPNAWYAPAAGFTHASGIFAGTGANSFSPNTQTTRAMMMAVLARINGADTTAAPGEVWYAKARQWAMANGVSDGTNPTKVVTREQIASMIWRLEGQPAADVSVLDDFVDGDTTSSWAKEALAWAVEKGLLAGKSGNIMDPRATATRAQVAQIMLNYATMK